MAGSHTLRVRFGRFAAVVVLSFFSVAGRAPAQNAPETIAGPMTVAQPSCCDQGVAPYATMGLCGTITESICGKPDPNTWRPLPCSTLLSEGWNEAWVPSPSGSGGAPRQGWINAADGNLYRLGFFTFAQGFNDPPDGDAYLGAATIFLPLSRRIELIANVPFVLRNNAAQGLPVIGSPSDQVTTTTRSHSGFGDITITPRVLLHETQDFSLTAGLAVTTPTGSEPLAGKTVLTPAVSFWNNICGGWVIRGGLGIAFPTQGGGDDTLISQLAIGQTLTGHDVPLFGDFTLYVSAVAGTPLSNADQTSVALTPGMRTHLGHDWYFLAGLPMPLTKQRVADLGLICWFMKAW